MQLAVHVDLALCDVASQVRDGMSDVCGGNTGRVHMSQAAATTEETTTTLHALILFVMIQGRALFGLTHWKGCSELTVS